MYLSIYLYIYTYIYICVCVCVCLFVCMYIVYVRRDSSGIAACWQTHKTWISQLCSAVPRRTFWLPSFGVVHLLRFRVNPGKDEKNNNGILYPGSVSGYHAHFMNARIPRVLLAFCKRNSPKP